jgi:hypothetical protein
MKCCRYFLCFAFALLLPLPSLSLCGAPQPRLVRAEYFASQLVVEATLVRTRDIHDKDDPEGILARVYTLRVNKVLRGKTSGIITVYEGNDSGRASFYWLPKSVYLLFLFHMPEEKSWVLEGCGNSDLLSKSRQALREITAIKTTYREGLIQGLVSDQSMASPIPEARVEALGVAGKFVAETDKNGEFRIHVPPGKYSVRVADEKGVNYEASEFSYSNPKEVRLEPGSAVQIQFVQVATPPAR